MNKKMVTNTLILSILCLFVLSVCAAAPPTAVSFDRNQAIEKLFADRPLDPVEGIWITEDGMYELAITKNTFQLPDYKQYDYLGVITDTTSKIWKPGEVKIALKKTAISSVLVGIWDSSDKSAKGNTTLIMKDNNVIDYKISFDQNFKGMLFRIYPAKSDHTPAASKVGAGTGFFITPDLVATNAHIIAGAAKITAFYENQKFPATVVAQDGSNDIAILKISGLEERIAPLPLGDPRTAKAGDPICAVGFPAPDLTGLSPKAGEGTIGSLTGPLEDLRAFQISVPAQPGTSGSPLLNKYGQVIGLTSWKLSETYAAKLGGPPDQKVSYAVKISYLLNASPVNLSYSQDTAPLTTQEVVQRAAKAVVYLTAEN